MMKWNLHLLATNLTTNKSVFLSLFPAGRSVVSPSNHVHSRKVSGIYAAEVFTCAFKLG